MIVVAVPAVERFITTRLRGTASGLSATQTTYAAGLQTGPTAGRVHSFPAPDDWAYPYLTFARRGAPTSTGPLGMAAVASSLVYEVKAIDSGYDQSRIESASYAIQSLLDNSAMMVGGLWVECHRESELPLDLPPDSDGNVYQHAGGIYRFFVTGA